MRNRLIRMLALLLCAVCLLPGPACAEAWRQVNSETGYSAVIEDPAGLLRSGEAAEVGAAMLPVTAYAHAAFLTCGTDGDSATVLAKARRWGDSFFGASEPYTVFMIDMSTRRLGIYSSQSVYSLLNTARANTITDNVYQYATYGDYAACAKEAFREIAMVMAGEKIAEPMKLTSNVLLALICSILISYLVISARMKKEQEIILPDVVKAAAAGLGTVVTAHTLKRVVHHESGSGGGHGGGGHGGGGGGGGGGGSHGF